MESQEFQTYRAVTAGLVVAAEPQFVPEQSSIEKNVYLFAYAIRIENTGVEAVQLINRHWRVFSGGMQIADVKGEGVVGLQPVIEPGESFQYTSGSAIQHADGWMEGSYTFQREDRSFFDVVIPRFDLLYPGIVN